ncbi:hypothetical protein G3T14_08570 [Methylobacterium sp. BTF04]|uniref:hypothetical protein n=1 Tax=Methylobacterium sp. BTF04 TaxID=2708300 RepID=UPI0013D20526|nr:hypothetical protein [Methylobacterium sp. BTF04]NEU12185.1 hypothetical protein [Methylobacterium sp. BTF04]
MRRLTLTVALALAASAGACAPKPIVSRDPVPAPAPGVGYVCDSRPFIVDTFYSTCEPTLREREAVLHAKG